MRFLTQTSILAIFAFTTSLSVQADDNVHKKDKAKTEKHTSKKGKKSSKKMMHNHSAPTCKDAKMLPKVECAKTVTSNFDSKGTLWIAWVRSGHIYLQSSTDKGLTFSPAKAINGTPEAVMGRGENRPKIKFDKNDNIYLSWTTGLGRRFTSNIRFSRSLDAGKSFSEPVTINDDNLVIGHSFDNLVIGQNGEVFITWLDGRDGHKAKEKSEEYIGSSLYYSWSNDKGESFSPNKKIASHTCQCCRLQSALDKDNKPVVVWRHIFKGGIRDHALLKFKDWDNAGEVVRISHENWKIDACPHHGTGLSIADDGTYHSVWFSNSETHQGLFYGFSKDSGKSFSTPINFAKQGAGHPHVLAIANRVFITWKEFDGTNSSAKIMRSTDAGITWSKAETMVQVATDKVDRPFLVSDGGHAYLSWQVPNQPYQLKAIK